MSSRRFLARIPYAQHFSTGEVKNHTLKFHKISQIDGSGKCDIYKTNKSIDSVRGVIYQVSIEDKKNLDVIEGLGLGYEEKAVTVVLDNGGKVEALAYYAITVNPLLKPFNWYKEHVLRGAIENNLPGYYIDEIARVESVEDHDKVRYKREMALYL